MYKTISPVNIWNNGVMIPATLLSANIIADNLINTAVFYYQLFSQDLKPLASGNITITGEEYTNWDGSNNATWQIIATSLNVTITGDYTPQP